jgi:hypothetical protein
LPAFGVLSFITISVTRSLRIQGARFEVRSLPQKILFPAADLRLLREGKEPLDFT